VHDRRLAGCRGPLDCALDEAGAEHLAEDLDAGTAALRGGRARGQRRFVTSGCFTISGTSPMRYCPQRKQEMPIRRWTISVAYGKQLVHDGFVNPKRHHRSLLIRPEVGGFGGDQHAPNLTSTQPEFYARLPNHDNARICRIPRSMWRRSVGRRLSRIYRRRTHG
jgi:hypothetical protein